MLRIKLQKSEHQIHANFFAIAVLLLSGAILGGVFYIKNVNDEIAANEAKLAATTAFIPKTITFKNPFDNINLIAKAAFVWDIKDKKALYSLNSEKALPLASLTKLMMAVTAADLIPRNAIIKIDKQFLDESSSTDFTPDEEWKMVDLINYSLMVSSNEGANAIAAAAGALDSGTQDLEAGRGEFVQRMNQKAKTIGLTSMRFENPSGLDESQTHAGAYGSAEDAALLMQYATKYYPDLIKDTRYSDYTFKSLDNIIHDAQNTNYEVVKIPGVVASKTGTTELAGGNLAIVFDPTGNHPIAISILGSTPDGRYSDLQKLISATLEYSSVTAKDSFANQP